MRELDLTSIMEEWENDAVIDGLNLNKSSLETAVLHGKYLRLLTMAKLKLKSVENKHAILERDKYLYFDGKMCRDDIVKRNWKDDPFDGLKIMKSNMDHFYKSDKDLQESENTVVYYKTMVEHLKEICDILKWRHQVVRNIIEVSKFEAGV